MADFEAGAEFFLTLWNAPIEKIALENSQPHGLAMSRLGRYTQKVQPWMFGEPVTKGAYLWLKNLPPLVPSHARLDFEKIHALCHLMPPGPEREKERSRTPQVFADAMVRQWGRV